MNFSPPLSRFIAGPKLGKRSISAFISLPGPGMTTISAFSFSIARTTARATFSGVTMKAVLVFRPSSSRVRWPSPAFFTAPRTIAEAETPSRR